MSTYKNERPSKESFNNNNSYFNKSKLDIFKEEEEKRQELKTFNHSEYIPSRQIKKENDNEFITIEPWKDKEIYIYPPFKNLLRRQSKDEHDGLRKDIEERGCITPLVVWRSQDRYFLVDGHNRHQICTELKIPCFIHIEFFDTEEDVKIFIIKHQLERRNLTVYERGKYALQLKKLVSQKAKLNQGKKGTITPIDTKKELAKIADISHDTIHRIESIEKNAIPDVIKKVSNNEISINTAFKLSKMDIDQQEELITLQVNDLREKIKDNENIKKLEYKDFDSELKILPFTAEKFEQMDFLFSSKPQEEYVFNNEVLPAEQTEFFKNYKVKVIAMVEAIQDIELLMEIESLIVTEV